MWKTRWVMVASLRRQCFCREGVQGAWGGQSCGEEHFSRWKCQVKVGDRTRLGACGAGGSPGAGELGCLGSDFIMSFLGSYWEA